jgi:hypothetical protein
VSAHPGKGRTSISGVMQPSVDEVLDAMSKQFDSPKAVCLSWLTVIVKDFDPKAAANRLSDEG